jgi:hypothetical protein
MTKSIEEKLNLARQALENISYERVYKMTGPVMMCRHCSDYWLIGNELTMTKIVTGSIRHRDNCVMRVLCEA